MEILFTHDDLDGAGCSIIFELMHTDATKGKDYEIINCSNNNIDIKVQARMKTMSKDDSVLIADICCSKELLKELNEFVGGKVTVMDHHPTNAYATEVIGDNAVIMSGATGVAPMCGTSIMAFSMINILDDNPDNNELQEKLFYLSAEHNPDLLLEFVNDVREYDTYTFKLTGNIKAKWLQTMFSLLGMKRFCETMVEKLKSDSCDLFDPVVQQFIEAKLETEQTVIDSYTMDDIIQFEWGGKKCGLVFNMFANFSEFGNQFLQKHPELDVMMMASFGKDPVFQMRSVKDDIDLGKDFAAKIGGGGHPKAAGAPFGFVLISSLINDIFRVISTESKMPVLRNVAKDQIFKS